MGAIPRLLSIVYVYNLNYTNGIPQNFEPKLYSPGKTTQWKQIKFLSIFSFKMYISRINFFDRTKLHKIHSYFFLQKKDCRLLGSYKFLNFRPWTVIYVRKHTHFT